MATNPYIQSGAGVGTYYEQELIHSLIAESIQMLGQDVYYLPRHIVNFDELYGEDTSSYFSQFKVIEVYLESWDSMQGRDDYMSKLGLRTEESASFRISRRRFEEVIGDVVARTYPNNTLRPNEGDLIYFPMDKNIFEIKYVTLKDSFYQLSDYYSYVIDCVLFQYSSEIIDTGVTEIQNQVPPSLDNLVYPFISATENVLIDATDNELAGVGIGTEPTNKIDYNRANKKIHTDNATISNFTEQNPFGLSDQ